MQADQIDKFAAKIQETKAWSSELLVQYGESLNPDLGQFQEYADLLKDLTPAQEASHAFHSGAY